MGRKHLFLVMIEFIIFYQSKKIKNYIFSKIEIIIYKI